MQYMQCKCGERQCWTSMGCPSCETCEKCGSTLGYGPNSHPEPTPHRVRAEITGGKVEAHCMRCFEKRPIEEAGNLEDIRDAIASLNTVLPQADEPLPPAVSQ